MAAVVVEKTQKRQERGTFEEILASVLEPGINRGLLILMHVSFLTLIFSLLGLLWATDFRNLHVWILATIAVFLYATMTW